MCYVDSSHLSSETTGQWTGAPWGSSALWPGTAKERHSLAMHQLFAPHWLSTRQIISEEPVQSWFLAQKKLNPPNFLYSSCAKHTVGWLIILITHSGLPLCYEHVRQDSASVPIHLTPQTSDCFLQIWLRIPLLCAVQPPSATHCASYLTDFFSSSSFQPLSVCLSSLPLAVASSLSCLSLTAPVLCLSVN